jgi:uncharacterized membrane protein YhiD involved in acid resistance
MLNRILSMTIAALMVACLVAVKPASARSKADKQTRLAEKVKSGIARLGAGKESIVAVKLRNKTTLVGYISEVKDDSFVVANSKNGTETSVSYGDVTQVKGQNLSTGAKIAIGIAIGVGVVLIILAIYLNCCTG